MAQLQLVNKNKEIARVELTYALTLFVNYFNTIKERERFGGHQNIDVAYEPFTYVLRRDGTSIPFAQLEALLWACQVQADEGKFWSPNDVGCKRFIRELLNAQAKKYVSSWDRDYCILDVQKKEGSG